MDPSAIYVHMQTVISLKRLHTCLSAALSQDVLPMLAQNPTVGLSVSKELAGLNHLGNGEGLL